MTDREMVWTVVILAAAYWWFVVKGKSTRRNLQGGRSTTGRSGTVGGGASKRPATRHNTNAWTNPQQGRGTGFQPAPIASIGSGGNPGRTNVGGARRPQGVSSSTSGGAAGSLIAPSWPTRRVTSTGSQRIGTGDVSVPSYAAIPLTSQGVGGGGSWLH
jgi:hypothetical protein